MARQELLQPLDRDCGTEHVIGPRCLGSICIGYSVSFRLSVLRVGGLSLPVDVGIWSLVHVVVRSTGLDLTESSIVPS